MSAYRLLGDAFSAYFFERVLFDDVKLAPAFRVDVDTLREARRLVREARKTLAYRATAQSTESQLLRPLAAIMGWNIGNEIEPVETIHGSEDGGFQIIAADGTTWARAFCAAPDDDLDATPRGRHRRFAISSGIARVLEATTTPYAFALNRSEVRLIRRAEGGTISAIAFDLDALGEWGNDSERAWRLLFGLTATSALEAPLLLDRLVERGRREMVGVGDRLGRQVLEAVDGFARSLYAHEGNRKLLPAAGDESGLAVLYGELLRILYRCLFALFAEARGLVPIELPLYRDNYAISTAHAAPKAGMAARLRALFFLLRRGADLGGGERIPAFGGALFAAEAAPLVESLDWNDDAIAAVIAKLTRVDTPRGQVPVSYRELDEERLGSIYERLLELRLSVADRAMERIRVQGRELVIDPASLAELSGYETASGTSKVLPLLEATSAIEADNVEDADASDPNITMPANGKDDVEAEFDADSVEIELAASWDGAIAASSVARGKRQVVRLETIAAGTPYLASSSGRKETASYYTARDLVDFLVRETIDPQAEHADPAVILRLRVVDPAMGSGHFLIGAMRRLADHLLAAYRRIEEQIGFAMLPPYIQAAWEDERELLAVCRQLIAVHCLYGVDKNPLAVDLARVALWLATAAADHPLSFLDHRLRQGDSLLGLDVAQIVAVGSATKTKHKRRGGATNGQYSMLPVGDELVDEIALEHTIQNQLVRAFIVIRGFLAIVDNEREPFELKRQRAEAVRSVLEPLATLHAARVGRLLGDDEEVGATAFVSALRSFASLGYLAERDHKALEVFVKRARNEGAFCWPLEFPDAYYAAREDGSVVARADAGFDVVLGNPPWDKLLIDKKAFYYRFDPLLVDFQGVNADKRIEKLNLTYNYASILFETESRRVAYYTSALVNSTVYSAQIVKVGGKRTGGHPDTYKYFLERSYMLASPTGSVGIVTPAAFTSGDGSTGLRTLILKRANIRSLFVFENRRKLFPIDSRFKFQTMVFQKPGPTCAFEAAFWIHDISLLKRTRSQRVIDTLTIHASDIEDASPERMAILEFRGTRDFEILRRMRMLKESVSTFIARAGGHIGQEFNMTTDRKRFSTKQDMINLKATRENDTFVGMSGERYVPLREGRMIQAFDANAKLYMSGESRSADWAENSWPKMPIEPHFWVREDALEHEWNQNSLKLYWCDVTGATNERTAMAAIVSAPAVGTESLRAIYLPRDNSQQYATIVSVFNSFIFDWYVRMIVAQHLSNHFVEPAPFVRSIPFAALESRVAIASSPTVLFGERADCRAEIDAIVSLAFNLSYADFAHVLATFPLLDRAEPPLDGEARSTVTRDLALAAYCRLAGEHDPEHADRIRAARALGALGYVATPLRTQLPNAHRRGGLQKTALK